MRALCPALLEPAQWRQHTVGAALLSHHWKTHGKAGCWSKHSGLQLMDPAARILCRAAYRILCSFFILLHLICSQAWNTGTIPKQIYPEGWHGQVLHSEHVVQSTRWVPCDCFCILEASKALLMSYSTVWIFFPIFFFVQAQCPELAGYMVLSLF